MIRLILLAIGVFIVWVLFLSAFSKQKKIIICVVSLLVCVAGVWFEQSSQTPKQGIIGINQLEDCGVSSKLSYRTNFDIDFCLRNLSETATAKRVMLSFAALNCIAGSCEEIQAIDKDLPLSLAPQSQVTLKQNLNFDKVDPSLDTIVWVVKVDSVKGLN